MPKTLDADAIQRIAQALEEHLGLELGDVSELDDADQFADLVEIAAKHKGPLPRKKKPVAVQMSHRRMTGDQVATQLAKHVYGRVFAFAKKRKAGKGKPGKAGKGKTKRVRMSHTVQQPAPGDIAGWYSRIVYGDAPPNN